MHQEYVLSHNFEKIFLSITLHDETSKAKLVAVVVIWKYYVATFYFQVYVCEESLTSGVAVTFFVL